MCGERVRDAIRPDLRGVVDAQADARLHTGPDHERGSIEVPLRESDERRRERRDDGTENERIDVVEREILTSEKRVDHHRELVLGLVVSRRGPPRRDELRAVVRAEDDIRVPDVRCEQRGH